MRACFAVVCERFEPRARHSGQRVAKATANISRELVFSSNSNPRLKSGLRAAGDANPRQGQ